ncbi:MAG: serine/threonine-protein kinase [Chloroflexi bacterium]|nr:MAG: serine/threonine-protein kinase [Chloroflexota bacterium]
MELPVIFNDRYRLYKKIGEGGLAEVFKAQDMSLGRVVAVKVLRREYTRNPNFLVNFHREAQSAARLSNPYIVAVYDFGQHQHRPYIVLEYIPGSDLRTLIHEKGKLPVDQAVEFAIQICTAVGTAHRAGLVHGDLKPGNILVTAGRTAKVTDFGLARALGESAMDEGEVVWGTPAYFAPEQAAGDRVLPATDVYAIGIILYEMLTGRVPFVGVDDQDVARKQLYEPHIPVDRIDPSIPEPLARIVDAAMAKNPNERFITADHMREALIMYRQGSLSMTGYQPPQPPPVGSTAAGRPAARRRPTAAEAATAEGGFDVTLWLLGLIAVIAVMGLIPLFVAVYNAYAPLWLGSLAVPTPLPELQPGQVRVPDIVGVDADRARAGLDDLGLTMTIVGEAPHPSYPVFTVISQTIPAGAAVEAGSAVGVVLSQGPPLIELPDLSGVAVEEAERRLSEAGLVVQRYEEWSVERPGTVISQDPPPGSLVANQTLVTLVVSSGARIQVGANFGGQILLTAYEIPRLQFRPGEAIDLTFFWQATTPPAEAYHLFVYLTTPQGGIVSQVEGPPLGGTRPTSTWNIGEVIVDPYRLPIPPTTIAGDYQVRVGFLNPQTRIRLPILDPGRAEEDNLGALILRGVQVVQ